MSFCLSCIASGSIIASSNSTFPQVRRYVESLWSMPHKHLTDLNMDLLPCLLREIRLWSWHREPWRGCKESNRWLLRSITSITCFMRLGEMSTKQDWSSFCAWCLDGSASTDCWIHHTWSDELDEFTTCSTEINIMIHYDHICTELHVTQLNAPHYIYDKSPQWTALCSHHVVDLSLSVWTGGCHPPRSCLGESCTSNDVKGREAG